MCVHIDGIGAKAWLAMQVRAHSATILIREKAALEEGGEWGGEEGLDVTYPTTLGSLGLLRVPPALHSLSLQ